MNDMRLHQTADQHSSPAFRVAGVNDAWSTSSIQTSQIEPAGALVIRKNFAGLSEEWVDQVRQIVKTAADGGYGALKFLVFDLAAEGGASAPRGDSAKLLLGEIANLILSASIVTVAHVRRFVEGADLELALACSMMTCEEGARFSFAADPVESVATYALLSQKIGFVRAERLMDQDEPLTAGQMLDLLLLKSTTQSGPGLDGLEALLLRVSRRHNSAAAMYRAQRIATPLIPEIFGELSRN